VRDLLAELLHRPEWHARAACRNTSPASFFADGRAAPTIARAKAVCAGCPVRAECEACGFAGDETGVWGGLSEAERHTARVGHPELDPDPTLVVLRRRATICGTVEGYDAHRRHDEEPCDGCLIAHAVALTAPAETTERARSDDAFLALLARPTFATFTDDATLDRLAGSRSVTIDATVDVLAGQAVELTGAARAALDALLECWRTSAA
jgi:WhiB family redox-sensing transcriptional regulator